MPRAALQFAALLALLALAAVVSSAGEGIGGQYTPELLDVIPARHREEQFWGTYRSSLYTGLRARAPDSPLVGLAWWPGDRWGGWDQVRHVSSQSESIGSWGWLRHDGTSYGEHDVIDAEHGVRLRSEWLKRSDNSGWTLRVRGWPEGPMTGGPISLAFYVSVPRIPGAHLTLLGLDEDDVSSLGLPDDIPVQWVGATPSTGSFSLQIHEDSEKAESDEDDDYWVPDSVHGHQGPPGAPQVSQKDRQLFGLTADLERAQYVGWSVPPGEEWNADAPLKATLKTQAGRMYTTAVQALQGKARALGKKPPARPSVPPWVTLLPNLVEKDSNILLVQFVRQGKFSFDVVFQQVTSNELEEEPTPASGDDVGTGLTTRLQRARTEFDERFLEVFPLRDHGYNATMIHAARAAFSNLVGGMGYFYGDELWRVGGEAVHTKPGPLYTAVPSRSFFPRGFLWDEGFHQLLVARWKPVLTVDVLAHWLALMDPKTGWIPREQIRGAEARSKVPEEFQVQQPGLANPPTLLLAVQSLLEGVGGGGSSEGDVNMDENLLEDGDQGLGEVTTTLDAAEEAQAVVQAFFHTAYPLLTRFYEFYSDTQAGPLPDSFQWRGRTPTHTLTSGLDDYPRGSPPTPDERHVDLHSWMIFGAQAMADLASRLGTEAGAADATRYQARADTLLESLDRLHWSEEGGRYADWHNSTWVEKDGYVSIFPLALGVLPVDHPHLAEVLAGVRRLLTPWGLRSLSREDPAFGTGDDYWRGAIWINMNYLTLRALHQKYAEVEGPCREEARVLYRELREGVVENLVRQYERTGYFWEQYSGVDGLGRRCHPFSGWTSLVVSIMAEQY